MTARDQCVGLQEAVVHLMTAKMTDEEFGRWDRDTEIQKMLREPVDLLGDDQALVDCAACGFMLDPWRRNKILLPERWHEELLLSERDMMRSNAAVGRIAREYFADFWLNGGDPIDWTGLYSTVFDVDRPFANGATPRELGTSEDLNEWNVFWHEELERALHTQKRHDDSFNLVRFGLIHQLMMSPDLWPHPHFAEHLDAFIAKSTDPQHREVLERLGPTLKDGPDLLTDAQAKELFDVLRMGGGYHITHA